MQWMGGEALGFPGEALGIFIELEAIRIDDTTAASGRDARQWRR
jgi:hypothetical protein